MNIESENKMEIENINPEPEIVREIQQEEQPELDKPTTRKYTRKAPKLEEQKIDTGATGAKKQGRPKKSTLVYDDEAKSKLAKNLQGLHLMGAMILQFPELALSDPESEMLADGIIKVSNEYGLELSGKTGATIQLLGAVAMIYWPRLIALKKRQAQMPVTVENGAA